MAAHVCGERLLRHGASHVPPAQLVAQAQAPERAEQPAALLRLCGGGGGGRDRGRLLAKV